MSLYFMLIMWPLQRATCQLQVRLASIQPSQSNYYCIRLPFKSWLYVFITQDFIFKSQFYLLCLVQNSTMCDILVNLFVTLDNLLKILKNLFPLNDDLSIESRFHSNLMCYIIIELAFQIFCLDSVQFEPTFRL